MTDPLFLSKSAFAVRIGRTPSYITWLKDNNRLVLSPDGKKVDVLATEALILETADPSKAAVAARHQQDRLQRDVYSQLSPWSSRLTRLRRRSLLARRAGNLTSRKLVHTASTTWPSWPRPSFTRCRAR